MRDITLHRFAEKLELAGYAKRTIEGYGNRVRMFLAYLNEKENIRELQELRLEHLRAYQTHLQFGRSESEGSLGRGALANHLYAIKTFLRLMAEAALIRQDLAAQISIPCVRKSIPRHVPDVAAMKRIIEAAPPVNPLTIRDRCILELLYATGIRSEELRTLAVDDWDKERNTLLINGKGDKQRMVPVGSWVVPHLQAYLQKSRPLLCRKQTPFLFVSRNGLMLARANLCWVIRKYARKAGVTHVCVHTFRHACATHLLENGADIRYVQELLGHADLSTTQIYTRVTIDFLKQAHGKYHPREREDGDEAR